MMGYKLGHSRAHLNLQTLIFSFRLYKFVLILLHTATCQLANVKTASGDFLVKYLCASFCVQLWSWLDSKHHPCYHEMRFLALVQTFAKYWTQIAHLLKIFPWRPPIPLSLARVRTCKIKRTVPFYNLVITIYGYFRSVKTDTWREMHILYPR